MWSAIAGLAGGALSALTGMSTNSQNASIAQANLKAQQEYNEKQLALQREQYEYQKYYDSNKQVISAKDYENAGLSKTLSAGASGSSVSASASPGGAPQNTFEATNPFSSFTDEVTKIFSAGLAKEQLEEAKLNNFATRQKIASDIASSNLENQIRDYDFNKAQERGLRTTDSLPAGIIYGEYALKKGKDILNFIKDNTSVEMPNLTGLATDFVNAGANKVNGALDSASKSNSVKTAKEQASKFGKAMSNLVNSVLDGKAVSLWKQTRANMKESKKSDKVKKLEEASRYGYQKANSYYSRSWK